MPFSACQRESWQAFVVDGEIHCCPEIQYHEDGQRDFEVQVGGKVITPVSKATPAVQEMVIRMSRNGLLFPEVGILVFLATWRYPGRRDDVRCRPSSSA